MNYANVVLKVEMSKVLSLRLKLFTLLIRLACWVGSVGIEFVSAEPPNTGMQSDGDTRPPTTEYTFQDDRVYSESATGATPRRR